MTKQKSNSRVELNTIVRQLAARNRPAAVAILARYGCMTAPELKAEDVPAVTAEFIEALKK